ncbi:MAG: hypothetical protein QOG10_3058 [Kribbellaceae bacterium]|nr:hypothetical protein [Kribbellaceae bacterium]
MVFLATYAWQALGQLLDYAASTSRPVSTLTGWSPHSRLQKM